VAGGRALSVPTDVADRGAVERLVERTVSTYGRLDAAFNNAAGGGHPATPLADVSIDDYDSAIAVSLRGVFLSMKYVTGATLPLDGGLLAGAAPFGTRTGATHDDPHCRGQALGARP
jgi:NADP-dependent 3-hydroxy acid dehydrogenase YdfG